MSDSDHQLSEEDIRTSHVREAAKKEFSEAFSVAIALLKEIRGSDQDKLSVSRESLKTLSTGFCQLLNASRALEGKSEIDISRILEGDDSRGLLGMDDRAPGRIADFFDFFADGATGD